MTSQENYVFCFNAATFNEVFHRFTASVFFPKLFTEFLGVGYVQAMPQLAAKLYLIVW